MYAYILTSVRNVYVHEKLILFTGVLDFLLHKFDGGRRGRHAARFPQQLPCKEEVAAGNFLESAAQSLLAATRELLELFGLRMAKAEELLQKHDVALQDNEAPPISAFERSSLLEKGQPSGKFDSRVSVRGSRRLKWRRRFKLLELGLPSVLTQEGLKQRQRVSSLRSCCRKKWTCCLMPGASKLEQPKSRELALEGGSISISRGLGKLALSSHRRLLMYAATTLMENGLRFSLGILGAPPFVCSWDFTWDYNKSAWTYS